MNYNHFFIKLKINLCDKNQSTSISISISSDGTTGLFLALHSFYPAPGWIERGNHSYKVIGL